MEQDLLKLCQDGIKKDEGFSAKPYKCTAGKLTIGYGRNIEDIGVSEDEAQYILNNDISYCYNKLKAVFPFFETLSKPKQYVLINMCYNIGITRLAGFKRMLAELSQGNYNQAASEMLNSRWAAQVPNRAARLAEIMKKG